MYCCACLHCFKCNIRCLNTPVRDTTTKKFRFVEIFSLTVKKDEYFFFFFFQAANAVWQVSSKSVFVRQTRGNVELITQHSLQMSARACFCLNLVKFQSLGLITGIRCSCGHFYYMCQNNNFMKFAGSGRNLWRRLSLINIVVLFSPSQDMVWGGEGGGY